MTIRRPLAAAVALVLSMGVLASPAASAVGSFPARSVTVQDVLTDVDVALNTLEVHNADDARGNLTLPTSVEDGFEIAWTTSDSAVVTASGEVTRGAEDKVVTLTATATGDGSVAASRDFQISVPAAPAPQEYAGYLFSYFIGEGYPTGEQVYFGLSKGDDPLKYRNLNDNEPVLTSELGEKGLRDPFIIRSPEGDKFYQIATDLKIHGSGDWDGAQRSGSQSIMVWESTDLVNWTDQRLVKVAPDNAGNTWAPEAFYDDEIGAYVVFWASKLYDEDDPQHKGDSYNRMMFSTTRDFHTFTEPQVWVDPGYSVIDSTVTKHAGEYYRFTKDERNNTSSTPCSKFITGEKSPELRSTDYEFIADCIGKATETEPGINQGEGPTIFKSNTEEKWFMFIDEFGGRGYVPFETTDLDSGEWTISKDYEMPSRPRHGTVMPVTQEEHERLLSTYQPDAKVEKIDPIAVTVKVGDKPVLPDDVGVTFADGSTGTVGVEWDEIDEELYAKAEPFTVQGALADGTYSRALAHVTMTEEDVPVTDLTVTPQAIEVAVGGHRTVKATVAPANASARDLQWASANEEIATVSSSGEIFAVSTGTTQVTVETIDGSKTASVDVTVTEEVPGQVAHYAFDETSGTEAANSVEGSDIGSANLVGGAKPTGAEGVELDGSDGHIKLPNDILAGLDSISVSLDVQVDESQKTPFFIYGLGNVSGNEGNGYLFTTGNAYRTSIASGNYSTEQNVTKGSNLARGVWKHLTFTLEGSTGTLYEDGVQVAQNTQMTITPASIGGGKTAANYIGRSLYSADNYLNGNVRDFRLFNRGLSAEEAADLASEATARALDLDYDTLELGSLSAVTTDLKLPATAANGSKITWESSDSSRISTSGQVTRPSAADGDATVTLTATLQLGSLTRTKVFEVTVKAELADDEGVEVDAAAVAIPNLLDVRGNIFLPTKGENGSTLTWASSMAEVISETGIVNRPAHGADPITVTLSLTASKGEATVSRTFEAVVQPLPVEEELEGYMFAYFAGESTDIGESIFFAASDGNDPLNWQDLNDNDPVLTSEYGEKGLRDPFIIRSPEGDRFFLIATDLKIYGNGGFDRAQQTGSASLMIWESTDLVNWSEQREVKVSSDYAGNTWAPEAFYDAESGEYIVYWASALYESTETEGRDYRDSYQRMMYATTRDFVTFSEPQIWIDVERGEGLGMIDSSIIEEDGTFYRFTKDEKYMLPRLEKSTDIRATIEDELPTESATEGWALIKEKVGQGQPNGYGGTFTAGEGPTVFKSNTEQKWYVFMDQPSYHGGKGYVPFETTDLDSGEWKLSENANLPTSPRHGTVLPVSAREHEALLQKWGPDAVEEDVTAPEVEILVPDVPSSGWFTSDVSVEFSATDDLTASPVIETRVNGGQWQRYEKPLVLAVDGEFRLEGRATDEAGNVSEVVTSEIRIDSTSPVSSAEIDEEERLVIISSVDETSGLDSIEYRVDSGPWTLYDEPISVGSDKTTVEFRGTDRAGNVEETQSVVVAASQESEGAGDPTQEPTDPTDPTPSESSPDGDAAGGSDDSDGSGDLPVTGPAVLGVLALAFAVIAAGGGLHIYTRRKEGVDLLS